MTFGEVQKILEKCEAPLGVYEPTARGLILHLKCLWLGDWLTYRKVQFESEKKETAVVHFEFATEGVPDFWGLIEREEEVVNIAYSLYRAAMLHECAEMFLYKDEQRFDPHCKLKRKSHCEDSRWNTFIIEAALMDNARCETTTNRNWGIPLARVFPKQKVHV